MQAMLGNFRSDGGATLIYNLDASALGARLGSSITTSALFNGVTAYLSTSSNLFNIAGDFTVEGWYYPTNVTGEHTLFCLGALNTTNRWQVALSGTSVTSNLFGSSTKTYTSTVNINTWTHIAVVRSGSTVSVYINGTASPTTDTQAGTLGNFGGFGIGVNITGSYFAGNISNFRVVNSAVYTSNFTTPTTTLRAVPGTILLMPLTALPFMDLSANLLTVSGAPAPGVSEQAPSLTTGTTDLTGTYTITYSLPVATFTGSISGTTMTVSGVTGTITTGMTVIGGSSYDPRLYIVSGSGSTWTMSRSVSEGSAGRVGARINWFGDRGGVFSNYFSGDGINAFITGGPNIPANTSYTVMMAYRLNDGLTANYGRLLNSDTASPDFLMGGYSNYPKVYFSNGVSINLTGAARDTVWHIDFVTFDKTSTVGNVFSSTSSQPTATPTYTATNSGISGFNQLKLFSKSDGNECAAGDIGMVKVWNGVLTTTQMQTEYNAYKARFGY